MDLVRKSARGKNPVIHKNNNKGAEIAGEMLAGSAFFVYANNEPKSALARDLGDCRDNKGKLAKRVFTCFISQEMPMELSMKPGRITAKTVQNDKAAEVCYTEKGAVFSRAGNEDNRNWCSWKICNCSVGLRIYCADRKKTWV